MGEIPAEANSERIRAHSRARCHFLTRLARTRYTAWLPTTRTWSRVSARGLGPFQNSSSKKSSAQMADSVSPSVVSSLHHTPNRVVPVQLISIKPAQIAAIRLRLPPVVDGTYKHYILAGHRRLPTILPQHP